MDITDKIDKSNEVNIDSHVQANRKPVAVKKTQVKKRGLSEFTVKIKSDGGVITGGEVSCVWINKTRKFNDVNELIKFIEEQCDIVWYPQAQRKLRDWSV
jgi:hypothetical protein